MKSKATFSIDKDALIRGKRYARSKNTSLSHLIECYINSITLIQDDPVKKWAKLFQHHHVTESDLNDPLFKSIYDKHVPQ